MGLADLKEETQERLPFSLHCEEKSRKQSAMTWEADLARIRLSYILMLDFLVPRTGRSKVCGLSYSVYGIVIAAQTEEDITQ